MSKPKSAVRTYGKCSEVVIPSDLPADEGPYLLCASRLLKRRAALLAHRCFSGVADNIHDHLRTREHGHLARVELVDLRTHSSRYEALQIRVNSLVVLRDDEQARFGLPRRTEHFVVEEIGGRG